VIFYVYAKAIKEFYEQQKEVITSPELNFL